ncbi:hypothetical protein JTE90_012410 [Oedothorax gibbosus]|uniref:CCHC-type domain-containing protein n=1 Tax=Oedothorax gibbosus TaxID=931172 RepID=A0AAV6TVP4_9ARAC|nr:hypothetical protein JTE90_012410 [Oedothorax gibbosus]
MSHRKKNLQITFSFKSQGGDVNVALEGFKSAFLLDIKGLVKKIEETIHKENNKNKVKKLSQLATSDIKQYLYTLVLRCAQEETKYCKNVARVNELEERVASDQDKFDVVAQDLRSLSVIMKANHERIGKFMDGVGAVSDPCNFPTLDHKEEQPVLIIDTNEESGARSYRDALIKKSNVLGKRRVDDIILPKPNRVIIKLKNSEELESFRATLEGDADLNKLANTKISKTRKNRLILFGAPGDITDPEFKNELKDIEGLSDQEIDIFKSFPNNNGSKNYIIDVNNKTKAILLDLSKIIINYNRVKIQNYVQVSRCFKCQKFGHVAFNCRHGVRCGACGGNHDTRSCPNGENEQTFKCVNCIEAKIPDHMHRADSKSCPSFAAHKKLKISQGHAK